MSMPDLFEYLLRCLLNLLCDHVTGRDVVEPKKYNQDKYGVTLNFAGEPGDAMFAVYDGHGIQGHDAALFARNKLPQVLAKHIRQQRVKNYIARLKEEGKPSKGAWNPDKWPLLDKAELERCCRQAFLETNDAMHKEQSVSDVGWEKVQIRFQPLNWVLETVQ